MRPFDKKYPISLEYGVVYTADMGVNPFLVGKVHDGVDYATPNGTPAISPVDGILHSFANVTGFGMRVAIKFFVKTGLFKQDTYRVFLCHLKSFSPDLKKVGQKIKKGQIVAYTDNTGWSSGPHCHVEVQKYTDIGWVPVDPTFVVGSV